MALSHAIEQKAVSMAQKKKYKLPGGQYILSIYFIYAHAASMEFCLLLLLFKTRLLKVSPVLSHSFMIFSFKIKHPCADDC